MLSPSLPKEVRVRFIVRCLRDPWKEMPTESLQFFKLSHFKPTLWSWEESDTKLFRTFSLRRADSLMSSLRGLSFHTAFAHVAQTAESWVYCPMFGIPTWLGNFLLLLLCRFASWVGSALNWRYLTSWNYVGKGNHPIYIYIYIYICLCVCVRVCLEWLYMWENSALYIYIYTIEPQSLLELYERRDVLKERSW